MALTYATIDRNDPVHVKALATGLVLGFHTITFENTYAEDTETLYCELPDGRCFGSTGPRTSSFDPRGRKWFAIDTIPGNAEFIGHYHAPKWVR